MITIRHERTEDISAIRDINISAFDTCAEADLVDALRGGDAYELSLVAVQDAQTVVGHILFTSVTIESEGSSFGALGLGPMAVLPSHQRKGIGSLLVETGLEEGLSKGHAAVVVLGHPEYYPRFGFIPSIKYNIKSEFDVPPEVFMVKDLRKGALTGHGGIVKYNSEFNKA